MNIKLISPPGDEPITIDEVKAQLRYTASDQDFYIAGMISAARHLAEIANGRRQVLCQWDLAMDHFPGSPGFDMTSMADPYFGFWPSDSYKMGRDQRFHDHFLLISTSLVSVQSFTYKDMAGTVHTLVENTDFFVDTFKDPGILSPMPGGQWPIVGLWPTSAIHIQFTAGRVPDAGAYKQANPDLSVYPLEVERNIKQGIMILVNQWFTDRVPLDAIKAVAEPPYHMTALFGWNKKWV